MFQMKTHFGPLSFGFGPWSEASAPRTPSSRGRRAGSHLSLRMGWLALSIGLPGPARAVEVGEPVRHPHRRQTDSA